MYDIVLSSLIYLMQLQTHIGPTQHMLKVTGPTTDSYWTHTTHVKSYWSNYKLILDPHNTC